MVIKYYFITLLYKHLFCTDTQNPYCHYCFLISSFMYFYSVFFMCWIAQSLISAPTSFSAACRRNVSPSADILWAVCAQSRVLFSSPQRYFLHTAAVLFFFSFIAFELKVWLHPSFSHMQLQELHTWDITAADSVSFRIKLWCRSSKVFSLCRLDDSDEVKQIWAVVCCHSVKSLNTSRHSLSSCSVFLLSRQHFLFFIWLMPLIKSVEGVSAYAVLIYSWTE